MNSSDAHLLVSTSHSRSFTLSNSARSDAGRTSCHQRERGKRKKGRKRSENECVAAFRVTVPFSRQLVPVVGRQLTDLQSLAPCPTKLCCHCLQETRR